MMLRVLLLLCFSLLTACGGMTSGRGMPAPVESRDGAQSPSPAPVSPAPVLEAPVLRGQVERRIEPIQEPAPAPEYIPPVPPPATSTAPSSPQSALLAGVDAAIAAGDLERAAAVLERALRISPRDAYLWYRLADVRYQQARYGDAEGFARRALSFAGSQPQLTRDIDALLLRLRTALGGGAR